MKYIFNAIKRLSDLTDVVAKYLIMIIMATMLFSTSLQVVCRYVFSAALSWPEEVNVFFMAWITFVGSSIGLKRFEHINVDLIISHLSPAIVWILNLVGHLIMSCIILMIIRYGTIIALMNVDVVSEALEIPLVVPRLSLAVGGVMMFIQMVYILVNDLRACPWLINHVKQEGIL